MRTDSHSVHGIIAMQKQDLTTRRAASCPFIGVLLACSQCGTVNGSASAKPGAMSPTELAEGNPAGNLIVFVGKRLDVHEVLSPSGEIWFDRQFVARYEVLSVIFGSYGEKEITFTSFNHKAPSGTIPLLILNDVLLLYVSKVDGRLIHEKYQYDEVYGTRDGRWASCATQYDAPNHRMEATVHPIDFLREVKFDLQGLTSEEIQQHYPSSAFEIRDGMAVCKAGLYPEELFDIRRRGVLKARGIFQ